MYISNSNILILSNTPNKHVLTRVGWDVCTAAAYRYQINTPLLHFRAA